MNKKRALIISLLIATACFAIDRISKVFAVTHLNSRAVTFIPGVLSWYPIQNRGIAFSMLSGYELIPIIATGLVLLTLIIWQVIRPEPHPVARIAIWMIIGGGLGNLYDRLTIGSVIDFIRPDFIDFAIFNAADVFVCVGCFLWIAVTLIREHLEHNKHVG